MSRMFRLNVSTILTAAMALLITACGGAEHDTAHHADVNLPASAEGSPQAGQVEQHPGDAHPVEPPAATAPPRAATPAPARRAAQTPPPATRAAAPTPAPAEPAPAAHSMSMVAVPAGTTLSLALDAGISSKTAQVGDLFTATVLEPILVEGREVVPAGSKIEGTVTDAQAAKRGAGKARLEMSFDLLTLPDGYHANIVGVFQEVTESKKKRNAQIIGGSAAGGALLGRILGKDTKGAVVGSIVGGAVGTAVVLGKEGEQAKIPADTPFEIRLEEPVEVPEPASGS